MIGQPPKQPPLRWGSHTITYLNKTNRNVVKHLTIQHTSNGLWPQEQPGG